MNKDILIIAHFCSDFDGKGNNRFNYIANLLANEHFDVELVTSDFSHNKKNKRGKVQAKHNYKITLISEPGYLKNVSLKRFYSHYIMGRNLKKYLESRKKPDVIYCAVPSLDVAWVAAKYAKKNNIRFVIDIQDIWPEAFRMIFHIPVLSNLVFYPMQKKAELIYKTADEIIAVSGTYANIALNKNNKCKVAHEVFLGTDLAHFDKLAEDSKFIDKPEGEIWLAYVGTLGHSYDITCVIDALKILKDKGIINIKFIVMGDGPLKNKFENYTREKGIYAQFTGRLDYGKMVGILVNCDIAVNPISKGAAQSIINKHGDYAAAGIPVLNTQECKEYSLLIEHYESGINCINSDSIDLADKLLMLYSDDKLRKTMGVNSRRLAEDKFDRNKSYKTIIDLLNKITLSNN